MEDVIVSTMTDVVVSPTLIDVIIEDFIIADGYGCDVPKPPETAKIRCCSLTFTSLLLQKSYRSFVPRDYSRQRTESRQSPGWARARLASTVAEEEGRPGRRDI